MPPRSFSEVVYNRWGVTISADVQILFHDFGYNHHPKRLVYTVFTVAEEPNDFLTDFTQESGSAVETFVNTRIKHLECFEIPQSFLPDWDVPYYWQHMGLSYSEDYGYRHILYMLYFLDSQTFIVVQWITNR